MSHDQMGDTVPVNTQQAPEQGQKQQQQQPSFPSPEGIFPAGPGYPRSRPCMSDRDDKPERIPSHARFGLLMG